MISNDVVEISARGFDIADYAGHGRALVVTGDWTSDTENALKKYAVDSVALNYARGYRERDLKFLHAGLGLRRLMILSRTTGDLSPIYRSAATLESLSIEVSPIATLDLTALPGLTEVSADWSNVHQTLNGLSSLTRLLLRSYTEEDLHPIGTHPSLERLGFKQYTQVRTLAGVENLPKLADLGIFLAAKLTDVADLSSLADTGRLRRLQLASCKAITEIGALEPLVDLHFLNISNDGPIASLRPLHRMDKLEVLHAYESTVIQDADLSPLAELPALREVRMQSRRACQPSLAAIQQQLKQR